MNKKINCMGLLAAFASAAMAQNMTGLIIDTSFSDTNSPAYADGDLDGQNDWASISGSLPQAFNIKASGDGFAETKSFSNSFDNALGRDVYLDRATFNDEGNTWDGSLRFRLEASPNAGLYATNIADSVTNIQPIAVISRGQILDLGLTADKNEKLDARDNENNVLINARVVSGGDINFQLNGYNMVENLMLTVDREDLGWDPEWQDATPSNAPIFETKWITLNWTLRKTPASSTYMGVVDAVVDETLFEGVKQYTDENNTINQPTDGYASNSMYFAMSHHHQANGISASPPTTNEIIHVNIADITLHHSPTSVPDVDAPTDLAGVAGDLSVALSWKGAFEADSFDVYRSEVDGGPYAFIANTTSRAYLDENLTDLRTYFYAIKAKYDGQSDSVYSEQLIIRAIAFNALLDWSGVGQVSSNQGLSQDNAQTNGSLVNILGAYTDNALLYPGEGPGDYNGTPLYGIVQKSDSPIKQLRLKTDTFDYTVNGNGLSGDGTVLMYLLSDTPIDLTAKAHAFQLTLKNGGPVYHVALRDQQSGVWYVMDDSINQSSMEYDDLADSNLLWRVLDVADLSSTELMNPTNNAISAAPLNSIDAIGFLATSSGANIRPLTLSVRTGSTPSAFIQWADQFGIYNEDAAKTNDFDLDGFNNVWEWGLGGDPTNESNIGILERGIEVNQDGDLIYVYPRLADTSARPDYYLTESDDLVGGEFTYETDYEVGTGPWPEKPGFEAVTNAIPTTQALNFIKLNIE